jgi:DNA polymerase
MDARERLRAYLEQRREMGESEFVLDGMSVADALGAIDKLRSLKPAEQARPQQLAGVPTVKPRATIAPKPKVPEKPFAKASAPSPKGTEASLAEAPVRPKEKAPDVFASRPDSGSDYSAAGNDDIAKNFTHGVVVGSSTGTLFEQNPFHNVQTLDSLAKLIEECTRCDLYKTAKCAVPGDGNPDADFMCVGEAPGANEDETGHPFVGQAGGLLTKILAAIDLTREQVFITNVLKHRPPANRNPLPNEVQACSPYLVRQIQMVKPKVILALGTFAAQTLLETKTPIGKLRGAVHRYYGIPLIVTYHPAALLRNPAWKRPTWEDVKLARLVLDSSKS